MPALEDEQEDHEFRPSLGQITRETLSPKLKRPGRKLSGGVSLGPTPSMAGGTVAREGERCPVSVPVTLGQAAAVS